MCDGNVGEMIGKVGVGTQGLGAAASAYGAYTKAKGEKTAYEMQAAVAKNNQQLATWQAEDAVTRGQSATMRQQLKTVALKGTQRAQMAGHGIDLGEGSALDILSDTAVVGQIDANTITDNATKEAWGYRTQASNYGANADLLAYRAGNTSPGGAAAGAFLTGAGSVASTWYSLNTRTKGA